MPDPTPRPRQIGGGRRSIGDIAPKLAELTDDVLFDTSGTGASSLLATAASSLLPRSSPEETQTSSASTSAAPETTA